MANSMNDTMIEKIDNLLSCDDLNCVMWCQKLNDSDPQNTSFDPHGIDVDIPTSKFAHIFLKSLKKYYEDKKAEEENVDHSYRIVSSETVYYSTYVTAKNEEIAKKILEENPHTFYFEPFDYDDWHIDRVEEVPN